MARPDQTVVARGGYISQFDSFRVIACCAVVLQHSLLWNVQAGNTTAWAFVMLLHFSRTAFFFLAAFLLTYSQITRPRSTLGFWRRRYVQIGVPFLVWTLIYWVFTMITGNSWDHAWSLLWNYTLYGYYQLYFVVVLLLLYAVFPAVLRVIRASSHHGAIMVGSLLFALLLAADLHYTSSFGVVGQWTLDIASKWPWARNPITYQEQFVAGILVALHFDQVRSFVERWYRQVIAGAVLMGVIATMWYLIAVWTGSPTGRASDLYQPVAFLWFTAAVAALECGAWMWWRRSARRPGERAQVPHSGIPRRTDRRDLPEPRALHQPRAHLARRRGHHATPRLGRDRRGHLRAHHRQCRGLHRSHAAHASALGTDGPGARRAALPSGPGGARDGSIGRRRRTLSSTPARTPVRV